MAFENSNSEFLRRLGGPTNAQRAADANAFELNRTRKQIESKDLYEQLVRSGIVTEENGEVVGINFGKLTEQNDQGMYTYQNLIGPLLNSTNTFGQFIDTKEGTVKQGRVEGFGVAKTPGKVTIQNRRPDTQLLAPKTWFASDDPNDYVAELDQKDFEDIITGNVAHIYHLGNPNANQADRTIEQAGRLGMAGDGGQSALGVIGAEIEKVDNSDADLPTRNEQLLTLIEGASNNITSINEEAEAGRNQFGSISKGVVVDAGFRKNLPFNTMDTGSEGAQKGYATANAILNADPNTIFSEEEVINMVRSAYGIGGEKPQAFKVLGFNSTAGKKWRMIPELIQRKEFLEAQPDDYTEKRKKNPGAQGSINPGSSRNYNFFTKEELIAQVDRDLDKANKQLRDAATQAKTEYEKDDASIKRVANEKIVEPKQKRISEIDNILNSENLTLSDEKRQQLEAEKTKLQKDLDNYQVKSVDGITPLTEVPVQEDGSYDFEALKSWYKNNEASLVAIGDDNQTAEKIKEIIKKYDIQSMDDMKEVDLQSEGVSVLEVAATLAKTSTLGYEAALLEYVNIFGGEQTRLQDMAKTQQSMFISGEEYKMTLSKYRKELGDNFINLAGELTEIIYGEDGEGKYKLGDQKQNQLIRNLQLELQSLPGAPTFNFQNGQWTITGGATPAIEFATKNIVGQLFKAVVDAEGSVDFMDFWGDFMAPNDPNGFANLIEEVEFTRNPDGTIKEIFFTPAGSNQEAEGSLKAPELAKYFGSGNNYIRQMFLAYISENGQERDDF